MASPKKSPRSIKSEKYRSWKKMSLISFFALLTIVVCYLYATKDADWWTNVGPRAPDFGDSETLVLVALLLWFLIVVYMAHALTEVMKNPKEEMFVYGMYALTCFLSIAYFYNLRDPSQNYANALLVAILLLVLTLMFAFFAYKVYHVRSLFASIVAVILAGTLVYWTYEVKNFA